MEICVRLREFARTREGVESLVLKA